MGHKPIKVLLWSPGGCGLSYGGFGMTAFRLYSKAQPGRFEITLAHGKSEQQDYPLFQAQHQIGTLDKPDLFHQWNFVCRGRRWVDEHWRQFDVFHGLQGFHITVAPAYRAQQRGLPAVVKLAGHRSDIAGKRGWKGLLRLPQSRRRMLARIGGVIAISQAIAEELQSYGFPEDKIFRIPNGVDCDQFHPVDPSQRPALRAELGWPDRPVILFVGQITTRKRPLLLVEALGLLRERGIEAQLVLAGPEHDAVYAAAMRGRIVELNLTNQVTWISFTQDVARLYRAADCFALPSSSEGMPNALLEAMASGLPSVATAISGTTDLLEDNISGRFIEPEAPAIAEAMGDYLTKPTVAAAQGRAARQTIEKRFSAASVLDAHERLFRGMMV